MDFLVKTLVFIQVSYLILGGHSMKPLVHDALRGLREREREEEGQKLGLPGTQSETGSKALESAHSLQGIPFFGNKARALSSSQSPPSVAGTLLLFQGPLEGAWTGIPTRLLASSPEEGRVNRRGLLPAQRKDRDVAQPACTGVEDAFLLASARGHGGGGAQAICPL